MQIVIDITKDMLNWVNSADKFNSEYGLYDFIELVRNGIPLPEPYEDCVSREDVLKKIYFANTSPIGSENILQELSYSISLMPSVHPESRWIPVSERLPQSEDKVLLFYESHYCHYVGSKPVHKGINYFTTIAFYDQENKEWYEDTEWSRNGDVISFPLAWMPLPEPYGGEQK